MGLQQSKVDAAEAVARCRERKQFMAAAVAARNAFAAAHSAYAVALKNTGAALSDYAHPLDDLLLPRHHHHPSAAAAAAAISAAASPNSAAPAPATFAAMAPPMETLLPPPPPLPDVATPLQRAATMPDIPIAAEPETSEVEEKKKEKEKIAADAVIDEEEYDYDEEEEDENEYDEEEEKILESRNNYETPPDSVLVKPPPPPLPRPQTITAAAPPPPTAKAKGLETWDYFFGSQEAIPPPTLIQSEPTWPERRDLEDKSSVRPPPRPLPGERQPVTLEKTAAEQSAPKPMKKPKRIVSETKKGKHIMSAAATATATTAAAAAAGPVEVNLLQVLSSVDDHFLKASLGAHDVSKMLEATRLHYHSNFVDSRGHIDHSARIMRVITWNRSFKGLPQQDDANDNFDNEESETHATVLDKMLAWEKKLYDESKEFEIMKAEYQRKLALLNKQRKRSVRPEVLEKYKSAVVHMQTRCSVDRESMNSTVAEIDRLRDRQLYPKLVDLVDGMAKMWEVMFEHHRSQLRTIRECRAFDISLAPRETSEEQCQRTMQLRDSARKWHLSFEGLFAHQKDYIRSLGSWSSLNLMPIESGGKEKDSSLPCETNPPIKNLLQAWHESLDTLPQDRAKNAVHSFAEAISALIALQNDELKLKSECEDVRKDLERKRRQFEDWHRKYVERREPPPVPEGAADSAIQAAVVERRIIVEAAEMRLKEVEENYKKLCKQVREKSIGSLRTHLPELFHAMSDFACASSQVYKRLWSITRFKGRAEDD